MALLLLEQEEALKRSIDKSTCYVQAAAFMDGYGLLSMRKSVSMHQMLRQALLVWVYLACSRVVSPTTMAALLSMDSPPCDDIGKNMKFRLAPHAPMNITNDKPV